MQLSQIVCVLKSDNSSLHRIVGAVIIQPINYKYDHSFLISIMEDERLSPLFKFVCLFNPTFETVLEGESYLEGLCSQGFTGMVPTEMLS